MKIKSFALLGLISISSCASVKRNAIVIPHHGSAPKAFRPQEKVDPKAISEKALSDNPSLDDYIEFALVNNSSMKLAYFKWQAKIQKITQAEALPNPQLEYMNFIESIETKLGPSSHKFDLTQTFPFYNKRSLMGHIAVEEANAESSQFNLVRLGLIYEIRKTFIEYVYLDRATKIIQEMTSLLSYFEKIVLIKFKTAQGSHPDLIRIQVELGKMEDRLRNSEEMKRPVRARFNALLNRESHSKIALPLNMEAPLFATDYDLLLEIADQHNPELSIARFLNNASIYTVDLAKKSYFPDLTLGVSYTETGTTEVAVTDNGKDVIAAIAKIDIPLWFSKNKAHVIEKKSLKNAQKNRVIHVLNKIKSELDLILFRVGDAKRKMSLYKDTLIIKAHQSLKSNETAYRAGSLDFLNYLDALRTLLEFKVMFERSQADYLIEISNLEQLVGMPLEKLEK